MSDVDFKRHYPGVLAALWRVGIRRLMRFFQDSRIPAQIGYGRVGDEDCQWPYLRPRIEVWCMSSSTVELISRPQSGQVTVLGPGFSYKAKADYQGPDAFTLRVSGTLMRKQGTSEIQVIVDVEKK